VIAAVPHSPSVIVFRWNGRVLRLRVPPSYIRYWETTKKVESELNAILKASGQRAVFARVPQKLLAVRSGLGFYGRNNICYLPDLGSHHMLVSYYSDRPLAEDEIWRDPVLMERCRRCTACLKACPSGAISKDRFPLRQDRCLTFYSGYSGPQEFPAWLNSDWIDCLIGCLRCQDACPENAGFRGLAVEEKIFFEDEETESLRKGLTPRTLPRPLRLKLSRLGLIQFFGLSECLEMLSAKLSLFVRRAGPRDSS
jgi:epoxyqueuosine reductase